MTQDIAPPHHLSARRHDLDAIRIGAFALLILYHIGMFYVPWGWHVNSARPQEWLQPLMWLTNPWRMTLLFLVSGAATRLLLEAYRGQGTGAAARLGRARLTRLGLPLLFGMLVIVPPQTYYQVLEMAQNGTLLSGLSPEAATAGFWTQYATASGQWCSVEACIITPTWNHLWFLAYVLVYGLLAAMVAGAASNRSGAWAKRLDAVLKGPWLLILPIAFLAAIRIGLYPHFPVTHDFVQDLYTHALSLTAFGFGFLLVDAPRLTQRLIRYRHLSLTLALTSYAVLVSYMVFYPEGAEPPALLRNTMRGVYAVDQWAFIAAILGYAGRHVHGTSPLIKYLGGGIFTFYMVHQTVIVVAAVHAEKLKLPLALEMGIVLTLTCAGCVLAYELARSIGFFGILLGASAKTSRHRPVKTPSSGRSPITLSDRA